MLLSGGGTGVAGLVIKSGKSYIWTCLGKTFKQEEENEEEEGDRQADRQNTGCFCVNLTQVRVIREKGTSTEKMPL